MILPGSHPALLLLLVLGMVAWGTWANTLKATGEKWRFELYCFDFAFGLVCAAALLAATLGSFGFDGFSFMDDLRLAGKRQDLFAFVAGGIVNLGNMLLLGAISLTGMAVAFPVGMGFALLVGIAWTFALHRGDHPAAIFIGAAIVAGAVVAGILAYLTYAKEQLPITPPPAVKTRAPQPKASSAKGVFLSLAAGLLLGSFAVPLQKAMANENGLGPYSAGFMFALGVFFSTFVYNLFFMNLPVKGSPVDLGDYFRARFKRHALGFLGGVIWYVGAITSMLASRVDEPARVQPSVAYALGQGGIFIAILCGLLIWHELPGADARVKTYLGLTVILLLIGIGLVSSASPAAAY